MNMNRTLLALATTLSLAVLPGVQADTITWTNAAGGSFHEPLNWSPNVVPFTNDTAVFELTNAAYKVTWNENVTNHTHIVRAGTVTFDLQGHTYSLSKLCTNTIGTATSAANVTFTNGTVVRLEATGSGIYGTGLNFSLRGTGSSLHLRNAKYRYIVYYASIYSGTQIVVDGPEADLYGHGYASSMQGRLVVTNGAFMNYSASINIKVGGSIHISGPGNRAIFSINSAGMPTNSSVLIDNGAEVEHGYLSADNFILPIAGTVTLGNARWYDTYTMLNRGLRSFNTNGVLQGTGSVEMQRVINNGGTIRPGGSQQAGLLSFTGLITNAAPSSVTDMELGGTATNDYDRIRLVAGARGPGTLYAGGILKVSLINGFVPQQPATFKLFEAVDIVGTFDTVDMPALSGTWSTAALYESGEITFEPAPKGTLIMFN